MAAAISTENGALTEETQKVRRNLRLASIAVIILNCLYLPAISSLSGAESILSVSLAVVDLAYLYMTTRNAKKIIIPSLIYIFAVSSLGFFIPTALFSAYTVLSIGGFVVTTAEKKHIALLICVPVAAYLLSFAITLDPIASLTSLLVLPAALALGVSGRLRTGRVGAVCATAIALIASFAAAFGLFILLNNVSLTDIYTAVEDIRANLVDEFIRAIADYETAIGEQGVISSTLDRDALQSMLNSVLNIFPALTIVSVSVFSFISQSAYLGFLQNTGYGEKLTRTMQTFDMSMMAGIIFFVAFAFSLTTDDMGKANFMSAVGLNIFIILIPGLIISGFGSVMGLLAKRRGGSPLLTILVFALIIFFYYLAIFVLAFWGAAAVIVKDVAAWAEREKD